MKVLVPALAGVPAMTPVVVLSVSPAGSVPATTFQAKAPEPPLACSVAVYGRVTLPEETAVVPITTGASTIVLRSSSTTKTSCRCVLLESPRGSVPSVFSQFEVNSAHRPSGETFGRGVYQNPIHVGSTSLATALRWCANRHTEAPPPAPSVCTAKISSSQARHLTALVPYR